MSLASFINKNVVGLIAALDRQVKKKKKATGLRSIPSLSPTTEQKHTLFRPYC